MLKHIANSLSSVTTSGSQTYQALSSGTGMPLQEIGSGRPLMVSASLAAMDPTDTEERMIAALERMQGQRPVLRKQIMFPDQGQTYSIVSSVEWDCQPDRILGAAAIVDAAFRSAPSETLGKALLRLRMLTRGRDQRTASDHEVEAQVWLEQLRRFPGDIVLAVLRDWPSRQNGQWWPTWHEVNEELRRRLDQRLALANFIRGLMRRSPATAAAIEILPESQETRERAVENWEQKVRPEIAAHGAPPRPKETPDEALARLHASRNDPVIVGEGLARRLESQSAEPLTEWGS